MKQSAELPAFACGITAVVLSYALFAAVHAQPATREALVACADAEGRLRMKEPEKPCPPGETQVPLKSLDLQRDEKTPQDPAVADLERRLRDLETHLRDEARFLGQRVEAPFEVFNESGTRVFSVEEESLGDRSVNVFNDAGKHVAWLHASNNRGWVRTMSATSSLYAELTPQGFEVRDHESTERRVYLGLLDGTRHGLRLFNVAGKMVAGIGQSEGQTGIAVVADAEGKRRFVMRMSSPTDPAGRVAITNTQEIEIASLSVDDRQNGLLQLRNDAGISMVEAGTVGPVGVVRAGPGAFRHELMFLGLPGSYIQGKPQ